MLFPPRNNSLPLFFHLGIIPSRRFPPRNNSLPCYFHLGIIPSHRFPHYIIHVYSNQNYFNKHVSFIHLLFKFGKYTNEKYVKYSDKDINTINQVKKVITYKYHKY